MTYLSEKMRFTSVDKCWSSYHVIIGSFSSLFDNDSAQRNVKIDQNEEGAMADEFVGELYES